MKRASLVVQRPAGYRIDVPGYLFVADFRGEFALEMLIPEIRYSAAMPVGSGKSQSRNDE